MPLLNVPGAELFYETHGSGPLFLFIPAAGGEGTIFHQAAKHLSANFTVITYDRRGFSQSLLNGEQDYSRRLQRDADDAAELIKHVASDSSNPDNTPIFVLGSSSGAIVALNLLVQHPTLATKVIVHEAPLLHALPEAEVQKEREIIDTIHNVYLTKGVHAAMGMFIQGNIEPEDIAAMVGQDPRANPYLWGNMLYWFDREFPYTYSEVPWTVLETDEMKERLVPGVSETGGSRVAARCTRSLAEKLGLDGRVSTFAGAHMGYLTKPEEFADSVRKCLGT